MNTKDIDNAIDDILNGEKTQKRKKLIQNIRKNAGTKCYKVKGEPTDYVVCDWCFSNISLGGTCYLLKCFKRGCTDIKEKHFEPIIICPECTKNPNSNSDYTGVLIKGQLEKRRRRPVDSCSAPYIYYVNDDGYDAEEEVIENVEHGNSGGVF